MGQVLQQTYHDFWKKKFVKLLQINKSLKRGGWGSGLHFNIAMTLGKYKIYSITDILWHKILKLHKATKKLQCNWGFINKIEVKIPIEILWMIDT